MIRYIQKAFLTLIEAVILFLLSAYLLQTEFDITGSDTFYMLLLASALIFVVFVKSLVARLGRFRVLHFSLKKVDRMTGEEFEDFLRVYFESLGCDVTTTKTSNDYGADLILDYKGRTVAVQAKRHQSSVGVKAVQEVIGSMAYYETDMGLVVTNSTYTRNAIELAFANDVLLWDRDVLVRMMNKENMSGYLSEFL